MAITIPGSGGNVLVFAVTGSAGTNYAIDFAKAVANDTAPSVLSSGGTESTVPGALNEIFSTSNTSTFGLTTGGQYTYVAVGAPVTVDGSAGGFDTLGGGASLTYIEAPGAGHNNVFFTVGDNVFDGSSTGGTDDTITGGSGHDIINTGAGPSTVFSGTGDNLINLNDTVGGDIAVLQGGNTTVNANGVADTVNASATGTIFGDTYGLTFVANASTSPLNVTIVGGGGADTLFGAANSDLVYSNPVGGGLSEFIAGAGNETLNGANAAGGFAFFGDATPADASSINDTIVGGSGSDYFATGGGTENIFAGSGAAQFEINTIAGGAGGGTITINDFSASDSVNFYGLSEAQESTLGTSTAGGNLTYTLSDGTKVEFVGITSLSGHLN